MDDEAAQVGRGEQQIGAKGYVRADIAQIYGKAGQPGAAGEPALLVIFK